MFKYKLQSALAKVAFACGVGAMLKRFSAPSVTILTIHNVLDDTSPESCKFKPLRDVLPLSQYQGCLQALSAHFQFVTLKDAFDILAGRKESQKPPLVITCDDGYANSFLLTQRIHQAFEVRPTVFLISKLLEERNTLYEFDRMDVALQQVREPSVTLKSHAHLFCFDLNNKDTLKKSFASFRKKIRTLFDDASAKACVLDCTRQLEAIHGKSPWLPKCFKIASSDECQKADADFGAHTHTHTRLTACSEVELINELTTNRAYLSKLGLDNEYFCYPDGAYSEDVVNQVKKAGFKGAVTMDYGVNHVGDDAFTLKRVHIPNKQHPSWFTLKLIFLNWRQSRQKQVQGQVSHV